MKISFILLTTLCLSVPPMMVSHAHAVEHVQELVLASHMMDQLNTEFGPFESFMQDRDNLKKEMEGEGLSDKEIAQNLEAMNQFYEKLQTSKKIILNSLSSLLEDQLARKLSEADMKKLIKIFNDPILIKFQKVVQECMPHILKHLEQEKDIHLKDSFDHMVKNLVRKSPS